MQNGRISGRRGRRDQAASGREANGTARGGRMGGRRSSRFLVSTPTKLTLEEKTSRTAAAQSLSCSAAADQADQQRSLL